MPDIAMCRNTTCNKNNSCYRYLATPCAWQSYIAFKPDESGVCDRYWKTKPIHKSDTKWVNHGNV